MKAASYVTVPGILVPVPFLSVNVVPVTVALCTASLNVAVTVELTATPVAPASGAFVVTVGEVASAELDPTVQQGFSETVFVLSKVTMTFSVTDCIGRGTGGLKRTFYLRWGGRWIL